MGKKSKKSNNKKPKVTQARRDDPLSSLDDENETSALQMRNVLAREGKLIALIAQGRVPKPYDVYLNLAWAHEKNGSYDRAESYLDEIVLINDRERNLELPESIRTFKAYLRIGKCSSAMGVYESQQLKEYLSMDLVVDAVIKILDDKDHQNYHLVIVILEDHLAVNETSMDKMDMFHFYRYLGDAYRKSNKHVEACEIYKRRLQVAQTLGDVSFEYLANSEIASTYRKMDEYDLSMQHYETCLDLLSSMEGDRKLKSNREEMKRDQARIMINMAKIIKIRAVRVDGVFRHYDAERAANLYKEACNIAEEAVERGSRGIFTDRLLSEIWIVAGMMCGDVGDYDDAMYYTMGYVDLRDRDICKQANRDKTGPDDSMVEAFILINQIKLHRFYHRKFSAQALESRNDLSSVVEDLQIMSGVKYIRSALLAQAHYFLGETDEAYRQLGFYLDGQIMLGLSPRCSACLQTKDAATNKCLECNSVHYCSRACQKYHWKKGMNFCNMIFSECFSTRNNIFGVSHKVLCPLLAYWRGRWKNELKANNYGEKDLFQKRWMNVDMANEYLSEECRAIFKDFFDNLVAEKQKEHKKLCVVQSSTR